MAVLPCYYHNDFSQISYGELQHHQQSRRIERRFITWPLAALYGLTLVTRAATYKSELVLD